MNTLEVVPGRSYIDRVLIVNGFIRNAGSLRIEPTTGVRQTMSILDKCPELDAGDIFAWIHQLYRCVRSHRHGLTYSPAHRTAIHPN